MWDFSNTLMTFDLVFYFWDGSGFYRGDVIPVPLDDRRLTRPFNDYRLIPRLRG